MAKILTIVAMQAEAQPTVDAYKLTKAEPIEGFPFDVYTGKADGNELTLISSGRDPTYGVDNVGTQTAAVMAAIGIREFKPDLVLNIGTAGGFKASGSEIGKVYLAGQFEFHDRRIDIPGFKEYGQGGYQFEIPPELSEAFPAAKITTGNSLDITEAERERMLADAKIGPILKDMEAAAIAQVSRWTETPFLALKSVTDLIDGERPTEKEFLENLQRASERLHEGFDKLLGELGNIERAREIKSEITGEGGLGERGRRQ